MKSLIAIAVLLAASSEAKRIGFKKRSHGQVADYPAYPEHVGNMWRANNADGSVDDGSGDDEIINAYSVSYSRPKVVKK